MGKTMKSKRAQKKRRSSRKVGGANVNIDEALQYLADHFPGAKAKALEIKIALKAKLIVA